MFNGRTSTWVFYLLLVLFASGCSGCFTNWTESYRYNKKQPFDLYALYELMDARPEGRVFLEDSLATLKGVDAQSGNYIFIGN